MWDDDQTDFSDRLYDSFFADSGEEDDYDCTEEDDAPRCPVCGAVLTYLEEHIRDLCADCVAEESGWGWGI